MTKILEKRFGNKQILISSNIDQLLSISHDESLTDIKKIRYIYDKIEPAVRNLKSMKLDIRQYGPVLNSIIMNKLPTEIKLQISRIMPATEKWNVVNLLEVLLQEINSRELCSYMSHTNLKQTPSRLTTGIPVIQHQHCTTAIHMILVLPTLHAHLTVRFIHKASEWKSNNKCFKYNSKHHISNCDVYGLNNRHGITQDQITVSVGCLFSSPLGPRPSAPK